MKKLTILLITITIFSSVSSSQEKGFSVEGGLGTSLAPSFFALNYSIPLSDNFYWILSAGAPSIVSGFRYVNYTNGHNHTLVFGKDFYNEILVRYSWVKEKNWIFR